MTTAAPELSQRLPRIGKVARRAEAPPATAPRALELATSVALLGAAVDALLSVFLYVRPTPFGRAYVLDPSHYVFHAIYYGAWAHALLALPFACLGSATARLSNPRSRWLVRAGLALHLTLATFLLVVGVVDRECQRFMGMHASLSWLRTYGAVNRTPGVIWEALASDRGGAWSSLWGLGVALAFPLFALLCSGRMRYGWVSRRMAYASAFAVLLLPTVLWNFVPGGRLRQAKVRPALLLVLRELQRAEEKPRDPRELASALATYQAHQRELDATGLWQFVDPEYPLRKHYVGTPPAQPSERPNFIVVQLETFRAKDMKATNPALEGPATTPFLDQLAMANNSALYRRYYANGVPTVFAFMAIHASILQHPTKSVPYEATHVNLEGFPQLLREHGYHTMHFTGSDPDWDSQRVWLDRWYDEVHFDPAHHEQDRKVFRAARERIVAAAREQKPFLAYLVSISNHQPFRMPEPALAKSTGSTAIDALHDTMRYTDDVVRELYKSLEHEPWFHNTIWIITGDHGYDLADRGESGGHENLRHETTWVPLIVHGDDARLPRGMQDGVASHLDLAPTVLELASVWADNSFMGHSLISCDPLRNDTVILRSGHYAFETHDYSLYQPREAAPFVYEGNDLAQDRALEAYPPALLQKAEKLAHAYETALVEAVDGDRFAPRALKGASVATAAEPN
jgi:arylsulfatase A-like enzyme